MAGHFPDNASQQGKASWIALKDGVVVDFGYVTKDDDYQQDFEITSATGFDELIFYTDSLASNTDFVLKSIQADYLVDDSFDYTAIDSDGNVGESATVRIDINDETCVPSSQKAIATEEGTEWVNNVKVIDSPTEGVNPTGNLLDGKTGITVDTVSFGNQSVSFPSGTSDTNGEYVELDTPYGLLKVYSDGDYEYTVDNANATVDALNIGDSLKEDFTFTVTNGNKTSDPVDFEVEIKGSDDASEITSITGNHQAYKVIDGLLDVDQDGQLDTIDPSELLAQDKGLTFPADNGDISIDLGSGQTDVAVEYLGGQAGYNNVFGFYTYNDQGEAENFQILHFEDEDMVGEVSEFLGTLDDLSGKIGFFIIPNGYANSTIKDAIDNGVKLSDIDGKTITFEDGSSTTKHVYYTDNDLSTDGKDHAIIAPDESGNGLIIAFEDLSLGDVDYDDYVVRIKPCEGSSKEVETLILTESFELPMPTPGNLVVNGSFEDVTGVDRNDNNVTDSDIANGSWVGMKSMTGWQVLSDSARWMEPHHKNHAGVGATHGDNYMDLGESVNVGGDKGAGYTGNTHIGQVINGVVDGQPHTLSFDYRDKAAMQEGGQSGLDSGEVEVYWGGQLIATIEGDNKDAWETFTIEVIGGAGDGSNRLEFKEVGEGNDNWGMALDNIKLVSNDTYNGWYVEHGDNGTNVFTGDNGVQWTVNAAGVEIQAGSTGGSTASDGTRHAELDPHGQGNTTMSTTITVGSNDAFELTFDYKPRPNAEDSSDMTVSLGGKELKIDSDSNGDLTFTADTGVTYTATQNSNGWYTIEAKFTGITSSSADLVFKGESTPDTLGAYIDDIKLIGIQNAEELNIVKEINISDVDDANLESATIVLTNYKAGDTIDTSNLPAGITSTQTTANGQIVLTLTGSATVADYETAIESITFATTSDDRSPRDFEFTVNDGDKDSNTMNLSLNIGGCTLNPHVDDSINAQVSIVDGPDSNAVVDASTGSVELAKITGKIDFGDTITKLVVSDGTNEYVIAPNSITVQADGTFTVNNVDVSSLDDGELTVKLEVEDNAGNTASDTDTVDKDTIAEISIDNTNLVQNGNVTVSGTTTDVEPGQTITIEFKDESNTTKSVTTTVQANGSWSVSTSITNLNIGDISVKVSVEDVAENKAMDTETNIGSLNDAPEVGTVTVDVSEEGLAGGIKDTIGVDDDTDDKSISGTISVTDPDGDTLTVTLLAPTTALASNGVPVVWSGNDTNELIGKANGVDVIKVTINNDGDYNVELLAPVDHADITKEDQLTLNIGVKADDGQESATGAINVNIEDDMPTSCAISRDISIQDDFIVVKNLEAGFKDSVFLNGTGQVTNTNTDSDSLTDKVEWGTKAYSNHGQSGYNLVDNSDYTSSAGSEVDSNSAFKLADFTHQNWTILSNSSTLDKTTITMSMDIVINGVATPIEFDVLVDHTETINSDNTITSRDIIVLPQDDIIVNVDGQDYTFTLEGFKNAQGEYVKTIYTDEAANNTFGIFATVNPTGNLPEISGNVCTEAGADGLAMVQWGDVSSPYGTMTVDANGAYTFVVNEDTRDSINAAETLTEEFTYTVVDKDGDKSTNTVTININGIEPANIAPEADDRHFELDCEDKTYVAGLESEYYGVNSQIDNLTEFKAIVSANNADATFIATTVDYGYGTGTVSKGTNLQSFLKGDAASLSTDPSDTSDGGVYMKGKVFLSAGTYEFKVHADDGYEIVIDGQNVASYENNQAPTTREHNEFTISEDGYYDIEMFWWDQGGAYVFKPEISSDGGNTYKVLDSTMLFTEQNTTPAPESVEFTLEDFVSDVEDDANSTIVKIKITSLPEDGVLTVNGNPVQVGDIYDETAQLKYTPNANQNDTLYGTTDDTGTLAQWGSMSNGILTTDDGNAVIKAYNNGVLGEVGFASQNNNHHHDGLGLGVVGSSDDDQIELDGNEKLVIEFKEIVTNAEFGLASLGGHFTPGASQDADAHWVAYKDGVVVASGDVKQSTDDDNPTTNSFKVDVEFDKIEFTTTANVNSNFSVQYMEVDYKVDDSFNYIAIDSNGKESDEATVTFDLETNSCHAKKAQDPDLSLTLGQATIIDGGTKDLPDVENTETLGVTLGDEKGDNNIYGSTPPDYDESYGKLLDFGVENAGKTVTITMDVTINGSWNYGPTYFDDNWSIFVNQEQKAVYKYSSENGSNPDDYQEVTNNGVSEYRYGNSGENKNINNLTHTTIPIAVTLDAQGKANLVIAASSTEKAETVTINSITTVLDGGVEELPDTYVYPIDISAALNDSDNGSETLSLRLEGVPSGATFTSNMTMTDKGDGVWEIEVPSGTSSIDADISMSVPQNQNDFTLVAVAKAKEANSDEVEIMTFNDDTIDLENIAKTSHNIDKLDLENNIDQTVTLDLDDVIDLTDSDNELIIKGDLEDKVTLDDANEWTKEANQEQIDGVNYNVYKGTGANSTVKLLIEDDIDVSPDI